MIYGECILVSSESYSLEGWEVVSVILTSDLILVTEDFFSWLLTSRDKKLDVRHQRRVETLENLVSSPSSNIQTLMNILDWSIQLLSETTLISQIN